jgi:hypothetical protein
MYARFIGGNEEPTTARATTESTSSNTAALSNVDGISFPIAANEVWQFDAHCPCKIEFLGKASGIRFAVAGPAGMTVAGQIVGSGVIAGTFSTTVSSFNGMFYDAVNALGATSGVFLNAGAATFSTTITGFVHVHCVASNGGNPGVVQLQMESGGLGCTGTVFRNSKLSACRKTP